MEIKNTYTIDHLTTESVSVKVQKTLIDNGSSYPLGEPVRTAYVKDDLRPLTASVPEPFLSAILDVWGIADAESTIEEQSAAEPDIPEEVFIDDIEMPDDPEEE